MRFLYAPSSLVVCHGCLKSTDQQDRKCDHCKADLDEVFR